MFVGKIPISAIARWSFMTSAVSKQGRSRESGMRVGHKQQRLVEKGGRDKIKINSGCETRS